MLCFLFALLWLMQAEMQSKIRLSEETWKQKIKKICENNSGKQRSTANVSQHNNAEKKKEAVENQSNWKII